MNGEPCRWTSVVPLRRREREGEVKRDACARLKTAPKLSVRELSSRGGISGSVISQIENGRAQASVATLHALASTLTVSLDELLTGATHSERAEGPGAHSGRSGGRW
jgi:transcriptional regulator with XRE-family HTH domain